jgi:16S rRNA processing protein RimM
MDIDACFLLGYITGTRGLQGEVHAFFDTDHPENYKDLESVFILQKGGKALIPFFVRGLKLHGDKAVVHFEEIDSKDQAKILVGSGLYLPLTQLPELQGDDFYYHELVSWTVVDQHLGALGTVKSVNLQSPQPLLVMDHQNHEILIPLTDKIVTGIDRNKALVKVTLPDGLLEVYLDK